MLPDGGSLSGGPVSLVIAAPSSGSGKTTVASLLCTAFRRRGLSVMPYKLGPDYLDPTHLARAAGQPARTLDTFLLGRERVGALFARSAAQADVCVLEGVMGLYDGRDPASDEHSTADLATLLNLPVILVIDASGMARTVAAVASGLREFGGPGVNVIGVILNRVGGVRHAELCETALAQVNLPLLGFVQTDAALHLPERHLGLMSAELAHWDEAAALHAARHLRLDAILEAAAPQRAARAVPLQPPAPARTRIAYALDEAFHFYYPDALDELRLAGAELVPFSPLYGAQLPPDIGGLLLGGGYPEAHAAQLSANVPMRKAVAAFAAGGQPVVAECGGLMYLARHLEDEAGRRHEMCGVVPYATRMAPRLTLGYREASALVSSPLLRAGDPVRGHEFHHSVLAHAPTRPAYRWPDHDGQPCDEGYAAGNVLASYLHLHYASDAGLARRFVETCVAARVST